MPDTMKLAEYLFARLKQLGIGAVHGVPGDFNLTLLDYVEPAGLTWVGNANELNAGYAADGYARIKGYSALITTFGVGELSAINAIAGAYAERAAVVHIVGTPDRPTQDERRQVHHTFNDGEFGRFAQMAVPVTVAQVDLKDPRTSPELIDHALRQCVIHSRPVYIQVPVDMVSVPIQTHSLQTALYTTLVQPTAYSDEIIGKVLERIYEAEAPTILVDGETRSCGIVELVQRLVEVTKWPSWTTGFGWGLLDETTPNVHGIYRGRFDTPAVHEFVQSSDLVLFFGPHTSTTNSYVKTSVPKPKASISISHTEIRIGDKIYRDIPARLAITQLLEKLDRLKMKTYTPSTDLSRPQPKSYSDALKDQPITQALFWPMTSKLLQKGDIILGETGSAGHGCRDMPLPKHARTFVPVTWLSIGYMVGAAQGAALAQREMIASGYNGIKSARTILFIGDGSFQMSAQELGTIIRHNLNVTVVLINNDGYTIERVIHGLKQGYNDIATWRYLQAPAFFGAKEDTFTAKVETLGELHDLLETEQFTKAKGFKMVEVIMDREDVPEGPLAWLLQNQLKKQI
ncbi:thiamine diphosphate-binding protein [Xylaria bambusicola]|uniref:thiamine diphosphate-binding protein n=1 Tax=Xylaria bambusicola TaxID=326684 RepID=UPI0020081344|nr:thiamine diphosphate-binding protein [Xylaria bambusicola]KAI0516987.1 thiamine diphosphate-binding protein [Xylaria bambusicola]